MMNEIYYRCDLTTGEAITPFSGGLFEQLFKRNVTVYTGKFGMAELRRVFAQLEKTDFYQNFITYEMFPHLKAKLLFNNNGPIYNDRVIAFAFVCYAAKYHPLDEMLYAHGRDFDRKILKRVNAFIEAEKELMYSY